MLHTTYEKVTELFRERQGYMSFAELKEKKVTVFQLRELEEMGIISRFSRGWYWCDVSGEGKPLDYRYIEIGLVLPEAVINGPSACYLNGILESEPEIVTYLTGYESRRRVAFDFPVQKCYGELGELKRKEGIRTIRGTVRDYRCLNAEETVRDCIHRRNKIDPAVYAQIVEWCHGSQEEQIQRLALYAEKLKKV